jgi:hypothetical protein
MEFSTAQIVNMPVAVFADADGDKAAGVAVHVVDAAFLLFQLTHQGGNKGRGGMHGKLLFVCGNPCRAVR